MKNCNNRPRGQASLDNDFTRSTVHTERDDGSDKQRDAQHLLQIEILPAQATQSVA